MPECPYCAGTTKRIAARCNPHNVFEAHGCKDCGRYLRALRTREFPDDESQMKQEDDEMWGPLLWDLGASLGRDHPFSIAA